jgi:phosphohistidine swiveling domain-containing protein
MWTLFFMDIYDIDAEGLIERELVNGKITLASEEKATMMMQDNLIVQQKEEKSLLQIVELIKETPGASNTFLYISAPSNLHRLKLHPGIEKAILKHQKNYFWTRNSWGHTNTMNLFEIVEIIKQILASQRDIDYELKKLENYEKDLKLKKEKIIKKHKMSKWLGHMFYYFSLLTLWRDERKVQMQKLNYFFEKIGTEIANRSGLSFAEIKLCDPLAIRKIPVSRKTAEAYKKLFSERYILVWNGKRPTMLSAAESRTVEKALEATFNTKMTEIRGMIACPGKVRGEVVVINKKSEFGKMQPGKILVTTMTRPEFVPLLREASAIVTDEGGITSYAAIVSRELDIPCIIGTKVATKVLKDGDIVEVNGNHGVVRVIE